MSVVLEGVWNDYAALLENHPIACAQGEVRKEGCWAADLLVSKGTGGQEDSAQAVHVLVCVRAAHVKAVEPILCLSFHSILHKQDVNSTN